MEQVDETNEVTPLFDEYELNKTTCGSVYRDNSDHTTLRERIWRRKYVDSCDIVDLLIGRFGIVVPDPYHHFTDILCNKCRRCTAYNATEDWR